jgi:prevent-host-death family protein
MEVSVYQAKKHLFRLLRRVADGEEVTISRAGVPVVRLVAIESKSKTRPLGFARGQVWIADDFDAPLPGELLAAFYGGQIPKLITRPRKRTNR